MAHKFVKLNQAQVDAYNAFFTICRTSTDPNVTAGLTALEKALDDAEDKSDQSEEPPGDVP